MQERNGVTSATLMIVQVNQRGLPSYLIIISNLRFTKLSQMKCIKA